jgi:hypothetical protein
MKRFVFFACWTRFRVRVICMFVIHMFVGHRFVCLLFTCLLLQVRDSVRQPQV